MGLTHLALTSLHPDVNHLPSIWHLWLRLYYWFRSLVFIATCKGSFFAKCHSEDCPANKCSCDFAVMLIIIGCVTSGLCCPRLKPQLYCTTCINKAVPQQQLTKFTCWDRCSDLFNKEMKLRYQWHENEGVRNKQISNTSTWGTSDTSQDTDKGASWCR